MSKGGPKKMETLDDYYKFDTIAQIRAQTKRPRATKTHTQPAKIGRHVVWDPYEQSGTSGKPQYTLVRKGIPIRNEIEADALFTRFFLYPQNIIFSPSHTATRSKRPISTCLKTPIRALLGIRKFHCMKRPISVPIQTIIFEYRSGI